MKRGIFFGLNEVSGAAYGGWQGWLKNPVNDARDAAALLARAGFDCRAVFNLECTLGRLKSELGREALVLSDGDTLVFYYSGHGGRSPKLGGYKETLCLADCEFSDAAMLELFASFNPGVNIIWISDSCHSGGLSSRAVIPPSRDKPHFIKSTVELPSVNRVEPTLQPCILLAACQDTELASDGEGNNGAFTAALLQIADDVVSGGHALTWSGWIESVQRYMARELPSQHPVAQPFGKLEDWNVDVLR